MGANAGGRGHSREGAHDRQVDYLSPGWRFVCFGLGSEPVMVAGVNLWAVKWSPTLGTITVAHPDHPKQRHTMDIHEVVDADPPLVFAAGEYSNNLWGFYLPTGEVPLVLSR